MLHLLFGVSGLVSLIHIYTNEGFKKTANYNKTMAGIESKLVTTAKTFQVVHK